MKRSMGPILLSFLTVAAVFAGCSDEPPKSNNPTFPPGGGSSGAATAGTPAMAGTPSVSGNGGTFSTAGTETGGTAGSGGETGGVAGGGTGGAAGTAGTAGTGGVAPVMVELLVDSVVVRKVGSTFGNDPTSVGGAGGAGGEGNGTGGEPQTGGVGGVGAEAGAGGEGPAAPRPEVMLSFFFDANLQDWDLQSYGSTPNIGLDGGPEKLSRLSTQTWSATGGFGSAGAMLVKTPFSTKDEQLDIHRGIMAPPFQDWSGYEIVAKVKLLNAGAVGECLGAWIYITTGPVFRFARGNLAAPLMVDDWAELEFQLDDPDPNSTPDGVHPEFNPAEAGQLGIHIQSQSCAP